MQGPLDFLDNAPIAISQFSRLIHIPNLGNLAFGVTRFVVTNRFFVRFQPAPQSIENLSPIALIQTHRKFFHVPQDAADMEDKSTDDESNFRSLFVPFVCFVVENRSPGYTARATVSASSTSSPPPNPPPGFVRIYANLARRASSPFTAFPPVSSPPVRNHTDKASLSF